MAAVEVNHGTMAAVEAAAATMHDSKKNNPNLQRASQTLSGHFTGPIWVVFVAKRLLVTATALAV
jgi:hypothetical protein